MLPAFLTYMSGWLGEVGQSRQAETLACLFSEAWAWTSNWAQKSTGESGISARNSPNGCERSRHGGPNAPRPRRLMVGSSLFLQPKAHRQSAPGLACRFTRSPAPAPGWRNCKSASAATDAICPMLLNNGHGKLLRRNRASRTTVACEAKTPIA